MITLGLAATLTIMFLVTLGIGAIHEVKERKRMRRDWQRSGRGRIIW